MTLTHDSQQMKERLSRRLAPGELFALALAFGMVGIFMWLQPNLSFAYLDFRIYLEAAQDNFSYQGLYYNYGYWMLPVFAVLSKLPLDLAYVLWSGANILGMFFAVRVFGGKAFVALASYQMFYSLIIWEHRRFDRWGTCFVLVGISQSEMARRRAGYCIGKRKVPDRVDRNLTPAAHGGHNVEGQAARDDRACIDLAGVPCRVSRLAPLIDEQPHRSSSQRPGERFTLALLLWLPPVLLRLEPERRLIALAAAMGLALPYFQQTDLLFLLAMPIGWISLLGNLGYFMGGYGWVALQMLAILPLTVYVLSLLPGFVRLFRANPSQA